MKKHLANLASLVLALSITAFVFLPAGHSQASHTRIAGCGYVIATNDVNLASYQETPPQRPHIPSGDSSRCAFFADSPSTLKAAFAATALQILNQENISR